MNLKPNPTAKATELELLAFEVARNQVGMQLPVEELLSQLNISKDTFLAYTRNPTFNAAARAFKKELEDSGASFELKARIQAEAMLQQLWDLVHDKEIPATVRMKGIENAVRWGKLEPPKNEHMTAANAPSFSITFNIPELPQARGQVLEAVVEQVTQDSGSDG